MGIILRKAPTPAAPPPVVATPQSAPRVRVVGGVTIKGHHEAPQKPQDEIPPVQDVVVSNEEALALVGLTKPSVVFKKKAVMLFSVGDRVSVVNSMFPWVPFWGLGDVGSIERITAPALEARGDARRFLISVRLDAPRVQSNPVCVFYPGDLEKIAA